MVEKTCRICGTKNISFIETGRVINGYELIQCQQCKTFMVSPSSADMTNSSVYDELFATGEYEIHRKQFELLLQGKIPLEFHRQQLLKRIEKLTQGRNLVEIGGGTGSFGMFCQKRGWKYTDYDISSVAVEYAKKLGLEAHVIENPSHPQLPTADVITCWEVIEHIWNVQEYLENIKKALGANGLLIISTPNYWRRGYRLFDTWGKMSGPPVHVNYFTEESLALSLKLAGFSYVKIIQPRFYRPSPNLLSVLYTLQIAFGIEPTKTLFAIARQN